MFAAVFAIGCLLLSWLPLETAAMGPARLAEMRKATVDVFKHGFDNYMKHAFPDDELRPVSCTPLSRDPSNPANYDLNDVLGNYSLTLIDSLSTLAILAGTPSDGETAAWALSEFQQGVASFVDNYGDGRKGSSGPSSRGHRAQGFDLDSKVQVFETVIRGVGGLLSAHLFAVGELPIPGYAPRRPPDDDDDDPLELPPIPWPGGFKYDGQLLRLALDLAERLLPAFYTPTGLPYPRVNLRHGIPFYVRSPLHNTSPNELPPARYRREKTDTCAAGAGSLVLEFTVLSRLSGDPRFEHLAKRAFWTVWKGKSEIGLVGNAIDPEKGEWLSFDTGIGAGVDSFFEYALKSHILLSGHDLPNVTAPEPPVNRDWLDPNTLHPEPLSPEEHTAGAFLEAWHHAHAAIRRHLYNDVHHPYYMTGHRTRGYPFTPWIDSLAAFYPGLLAMAGEVEEGQEANLLYTALWTRYGALPERWSVRERQIDSGIGWWPGRPEFIESNYYLFRATNDPWYLHVGEMVLADIHRLCHTECGWAGLQNVDTKEKADRMQSFFLGETTKYLYLLFDPEHPFNKLDSTFVFSTEAHPLIIPRRRSKPKLHGSPQQRLQQEIHDKLIKGVDPYYDVEYTNTCPPPSKEMPLTGSALAARDDVFHAASFVQLHKAGNPYSGIEAVPSQKDANKTVLRYKANHTVFPWTLPDTMLPQNGTCAALAFKPTLLIEFPANVQPAPHAGSALNQLLINSAATKTPFGARINSLSGLKITFVMEDSFDQGYENAWRVTQLNHISLGKDEVVHIDADLMDGISDPLFNRVRYHPYTDLVLVYSEELPPDNNATAGVEEAAAAMPGEEKADALFMGKGDGNQVPLEPAEEDHSSSSTWVAQEESTSSSMGVEEKSLDPSYRSMLKSFVRAVTSVFDPTHTPIPGHGNQHSAGPVLHLETYKAALPVGRGAVPLPDVPDSPLNPIPHDDKDDTGNGNSNGNGDSSRHSQSHTQSQSSTQSPAPLPLPWSTVYHAGQACDSRLADTAPRDHQIIVMLRGGCSFSKKLSNIPAFTPSPDSLQLVIIVDNNDDDSGGFGDNGWPFNFGDGLSEQERDELVFGGQLGRPPWEVAVDMIKPHLDEEQRTPGGLPRHHPVSMVMVRGGAHRGESVYEKLGRAEGVGVRRKYAVETQGTRVDNIVVL